MAKATDYKPKDFHSITPYLMVDDADKFIEFVKNAFNAEEKGRYKDPKTGRIMHSVFRQAVNAGGTSKTEPRDQFYGDRESFVQDPFGNDWFISTRIKDVSEEELKEHEVASN